MGWQAKFRTFRPILAHPTHVASLVIISNKAFLHAGVRLDYDGAPSLVVCFRRTCFFLTREKGTAIHIKVIPASNLVDIAALLMALMIAAIFIHMIVTGLEPLHITVLFSFGLLGWEATNLRTFTHFLKRTTHVIILSLGAQIFRIFSAFVIFHACVWTLASVLVIHPFTPVFIWQAG